MTFVKSRLTFSPENSDAKSKIVLKITLLYSAATAMVNNFRFFVRQHTYVRTSLSSGIMFKVNRVQCLQKQTGYPRWLYDKCAFRFRGKVFFPIVRSIVVLMGCATWFLLEVCFFNHQLRLKDTEVTNSPPAQAAHIPGEGQNQCRRFGQK